MGVKKLVAAALVLAAATACAHEIPPYESRYTTPPPPAPPPPPLAPGLSYLDTFDRADTPLGLGEGWDIRRGVQGEDIDSVPTGAFIRDGHYVSSNDNGVYAVRTFRSTVRRIGAEGRWTRIGTGGDETFVMGIAASDDLTGNMVQLTVTPAGWTVSKRRGSVAPESVVAGKFSPPLEVNRTYRFEMDTADGTVTVRVPGVEKTSKLGTIGLLSERAYWQHYSPPVELPIGAKFCIDMLWAAEQGQPLSPLPVPPQ